MSVSISKSGAGAGLEVITLAPQTGTAIRMKRGQKLVVEDPEGGQVADLFCFPADDLTDPLSSGRSIDYNETIAFTTGHTLYAGSSRHLMTIEGDTCGTHDFLVTPCSLEMFRKAAHDDELQHPSCLENLSKALEKFGVDPTRIGTTFNIFMNVPVEASGRIRVETPPSKPGARAVFVAETDLIVGLTACSDPGSNGGRCKTIRYLLE